MQKPDELRELAWVRHALVTGEAKKIREMAMLTTGDAAAANQVTPVTVWRWENNLRTPRREAGIRYGRFLRALAAELAREAA